MNALPLRLAGAATLFLLFSACYKPIETSKVTIPGNTLVLEFAAPVKYVVELKIDGEIIPVKYGGNKRRLWIQGLEPGRHTFNIHSISYVFGPEFESFTVDENNGAHYFIQARRYRSAIPKSKDQVSIRAYRRKLRKAGVDVNKPKEGELIAVFKDLP